jgi:hypothetical protein
MEQESSDSAAAAPAGVDPAPARAARTLVADMVKAGQWPDPQLLEQILAAGDDAVEPLLDVLRDPPTGWPGIAALGHAVQLLSMLRRPEAIPEVCKVVEDFDDRDSADAADSLIEYGEAGFDAIINLILSLPAEGIQRSYAIDAAARAARADPGRRERVTETLRPMLVEAIAVARRELKVRRSLRKSDKSTAESETAVTGDAPEVDDEADDGDDDYLIDLATAESLTVVATALASIADPPSRELITTAFDEGLVDEDILTREEVDQHYAGLIKWRERSPLDWLEAHREDFQIHVESTKQRAALNAARGKYLYQDRYDEGEPPAGVPATAPIRNTEPRPGRNDPCWCGSGKKYKKCHLGKGPAV